jgi:hypothetical protein
LVIKRLEYNWVSICARSQREVGEEKRGWEENMTEVPCMHVWKGHNEIHLKNARKMKKGMKGRVDKKE